MEFWIILIMLLLWAVAKVEQFYPRPLFPLDRALKGDKEF